MRLSHRARSRGTLNYSKAARTPTMQNNSVPEARPKIARQFTGGSTPQRIHASRREA